MSAVPGTWRMFISTPLIVWHTSIAVAAVKGRSVVVTMFSISELACASSMGMILISIPWFGIRFAIPLEKYVDQIRRTQ